MANNRMIRKWINRFGQVTGCLVFVLVLSATFSVGAVGGNIITSGCIVKVSSGTVVSSADNLLLNTGGEIRVQGTLVLKSNLVNQNTSPDSLGTGTIEFSGSSNQSIQGQNIIQNMTVNNSAGVSISGNTRVSGTLTLTSGRVTLGSNTLSLGPSSSISGTPSASNMIVPAGTGQLQKEFPGGFTGSFIFPVGDTTGVAEYSPDSLNFVSGTFAVGNHVGVTLVNAKYPIDSINGSYLKRYWTLSQSGISSFNCNATFQYVSADVNGTESAIYCAKVNPSPWITYSPANSGSHKLTATGLTSFGTFTGALAAADVSLKAYLEGPYNTGTAYMNTTLNTAHLIPASQPYNTSPWNYAGPEHVTGAIPDSVVDWVLIELRQADIPAHATSSTIIKKRAALLKKDGTIVDLDGTSPLRFYNAAIITNLFPVVRHRNHLAIMAGNAVTQNGGVYTYNFSTSIAQAYGGANGYKQIGISPERYGMVSADVDQDGNVFLSDYNNWAVDFGNTLVYYKSDIDMDGSVFLSDYNKWAVNFGTSFPVDGYIPKPKYSTAVPN